MAYFNGKTAVITGAGSGIGRSLALQLNEQGCRLWLSDISSEGLEGTVNALPNSDVACDTRVVDVADRGAMEAWAESVAEYTPSVELVVNNAGVGLMGLVKDVAYDDFHWLMDINFWGVVHGSQAFLPLLEKSQRSHLVNISSVFGMIGVPTQSAYNAAKFAVKGYSESLRQELNLEGSPVSVTCVHPGGIDTNIARRARNADRSVSGEEQQAAFDPHVRTSPDEAARQILKAAERRKARLLIGPDARIIDWIVRLFPTAYASLFRRRMEELAPH